MNRTFLPILIVGIIILVAGAGFIYIDQAHQSAKPDIHVMRDYLPNNPYLSTQIENSTGGNWTMVILEDYKPQVSSGVVMIIWDNKTGNRTVEKLVSDLTPDKYDNDAIFIDHNSNTNLDKGDSIILNGSSPNIKSGYVVDFKVRTQLILERLDVP